MSYGQLRFLYHNYVTQNMITPSSQAPGRVSNGVKSGDGVATLAITGDFAGLFDLSYTLEIDSVSAGKEVGEATFKWQTDYSVGWEETGIVTRTTPVYLLSADGLGSSLSVAHTGGVENDFELADTWKWFAKATYGRERLLDRDRNTFWRTTGDTSESLIIDLGSALTPTAFLLQDHNLTSGATVTLEGNSSNAWGAPAYSYNFTTITDPLILYLSQTYRYWRVAIADAANPDTYIQIGNLFLGDYVTLSKVNADWGSGRGDGYNLQNNTSMAGIMRRYAYSRSRTLDLNFGNTLRVADIEKFIAIQEALVDADTHRVKPFWVHLFYDNYADLTLMEWQNLAEFGHEYFQYLLYSGVNLKMTEAVKTL